MVADRAHALAVANVSSLSGSAPLWLLDVAEHDCRGGRRRGLNNSPIRRPAEWPERWLKNDNP